MILIEPMLAQPSTASSNRRAVNMLTLARSHDWIAQEKVDGIRAIVYCDGNRARIFTREGNEITEKFPEIASLALPECVLDGEIVARDGRFLTVATRAKKNPTRHGSQAVEDRHYSQLAKADPCYLVAFDIMRHGARDVTRLPLKDRVILLRGIIGRRRNIRPVRQSQDIQRLWEEVLADGGEGIICKMKSSPYLPGKRAGSWLKFKAAERITCVATGYHKGVRGELGAITLSLVNSKNAAVPAGRVGTGWTREAGRLMKERLDAGEVFLVDVEAVNVTSKGELRHAVFKGERTDLAISAATSDQLAALNTY